MPAAVTAGLVYHDIAVRYETEVERVTARWGQLAEELPTAGQGRTRGQGCFASH